MTFLDAPSIVVVRAAGSRTGTSPCRSKRRALAKALGLQIRLLRREQGLSTAALATAASISIGMMSKVENGKTSPSLSTIGALAEALDTTISSLFVEFDRRDSSPVLRPSLPGQKLSREPDVYFGGRDYR